MSGTDSILIEINTKNEIRKSIDNRIGKWLRIGIGIVVAIGIDIEDIPVWINLEMAVNVGSCPARNRREKDDYNNQDDS